jgi:hypothetical protein
MKLIFCACGSMVPPPPLICKYGRAAAAIEDSPFHLVHSNYPRV